MNPLKDFEAVRQRAVERACQSGALKLVLACADDPPALKALEESRHLGLIQPLLIGDIPRIQRLALQVEVDLLGFELISERDLHKANICAADLVARGEADLLMKGKTLAYEFLQAALHDCIGLKKNHQIWSHVGVFWPRSLGRFLLVTDGGMVIDPQIEEIPQIIANAVEVAEVLGLKRPRVALLAAVESVYPNMPVAMGGAVIAKMADRGQIKGAIVDGPLSLDVAVSPEAAREKGVGGEVAGRADVLVVNKIEVGNALCKSIFIFGQARSAGLVIGPKQPIILTSRSESVDAKVNSIALATLLVNR